MRRMSKGEVLIWAVSIRWAVVGPLLCSNLVRGKPGHPLDSCATAARCVRPTPVEIRVKG